MNILSSRRWRNTRCVSRTFRPRPTPRRPFRRSTACCGKSATVSAPCRSEVEPEMIELPQNKLFVGGDWEEGTGAEIVSIFPADGSVNRVLRGASVTDGERAIERAKRAQADPAWRNLKPHERARFLYAIADGIEANAQRIAYIQSRDTGKTLRETSALAASAAGTFRYFGAVLETSDEALTAQRGDALTMSVHEPLGLVGAITPWNSPI